MQRRTSDDIKTFVKLMGVALVLPIVPCGIFWLSFGWWDIDLAKTWLMMSAVFAFVFSMGFLLQFLLNSVLDVGGEVPRDRLMHPEGKWKFILRSWVVLSIPIVVAILYAFFLRADPGETASPWQTTTAAVLLTAIFVGFAFVVAVESWRRRQRGSSNSTDRRWSRSQDRP